MPQCHFSIVHPKGCFIYIYVQAAHLFEYLKELAWLESETTYRVLGADLKSTIPRRLVPLKFLCCNESRYFNAEE